VLWLRKLLFRLTRAWIAMRERALRRMTPAGFGVAAGWLISGILVVDTDQTLAYQAFAFLSALLFLALLGSFRFYPAISIQRRLPRFATAGQKLEYRWQLHNRTRHKQAGMTLLEEFEDPQAGFEAYLAAQLAQERRMKSFAIAKERERPDRRFAEARETPLPLLGPHEKTETVAALQPLRRGLLRFTGLTLARTDPFGIFRAVRRSSLPDSLLVLPKRYRLPGFQLPGKLRYQRGGVALASSVGQSEEFVALREYRRGDPLRHLHWRSWAKIGKPVVKEFQDEFFVRHALILDTFTEDPESLVFEEAVSVAASLACTIQTQESLLDIMFVGTKAVCFTAGRGLAHNDQVLELLASVRPCFQPAWDTLTQIVLGHTPLVSGCICVFLAWDEPRRQLVQRLLATGTPPLVLVIAEKGDKPLDPGPMSREPENFRVLRAGEIEESFGRG
jgi:uncharacterized protein (DUF58 family)